ncbi:MAG: VWA domain-containing protein [Myxococcaceae bacterium]|nr:MAG: VWA domain-containing protein [Myxococcaceae bacterium]
MGHEKPIEPFSDLHREGDRVRAVLLHDPTVEGLDMAIYMDASGSMREEYKYETKPRSFLEWIRGAPLKGTDVNQYKFPGAKQLGGFTYLEPALRDYVKYLEEQVKVGAKRGCAIVVTDGRLHDAEAVEKFSAEVAKKIATGKLPRINFVLVGVGDDIDEEQLEHIAHEEYPGVGHLWCHRIAKEITQVAELVAVLVDETMTVAAGGTIYDDKGKILKTYEGRLPAVLEFDVPEGAKSFTLEVSGQRYTQPLPDEEHHDEDEDEDHH